MASDPLQYYIGKGVVSWTPAGGSKRDLGNVPTLEFQPTLETLDHFSSRSGVKTKDRSVVLSKGGTLRIVLEEWTADNLALALMGENTSGTIDIFSTNAISGELEFVSANEVGPSITLKFYNVTFRPNSNLGFITDEWGQIELEGEVLVAASGANSGKVGTMAVVAATDGSEV